jgi:hypothetical protein
VTSLERHGAAFLGRLFQSVASRPWTLPRYQYHGPLAAFPVVAVAPDVVHLAGGLLSCDYGFRLMLLLLLLFRCDDEGMIAGYRMEEAQGSGRVYGLELGMVAGEHDG